MPKRSDYSPCGRHFVVLAQHSDQVLNAFLTMADRQDLLLLRMAEDLRQRVLEPVALIGEPTLPISAEPGSPIRSIRGLGMGLAKVRMVIVGCTSGWPPGNTGWGTGSAASRSGRGGVGP
jgi:hypothetical protein